MGLYSALNKLAMSAYCCGQAPIASLMRVTLFRSSGGGIVYNSMKETLLDTAFGRCICHRPIQCQVVMGRQRSCVFSS